MSSVGRGYSQVDARTKFFIALSGTTYFTVNEGSTVSAVMTQAAFDAAVYQPSPGITSSLFRDMGRQVTTTDTANHHVALYRLVQRQLGGGSEGTSENYEYDTFYIRVWAADPITYPVTVARLG
uniref:Uncharacterized protein n=1 Tax=viral metagenome TaxID=1070528 RepID=A0A6C0KZP4_9ZZZZ